MKSEKESSCKWDEDWKRANKFYKTALNLKDTDINTSANRAYFSAERAVVAALKFNSLDVSIDHKNNWTHSMLLKLDIDIFTLLSKLYDLRLQGDYGKGFDIVELNEQSLNIHLDKLKQLLDEIKEKYGLDKG